MKIKITYKSIWKVAYPLILGSLANNLLNVVDTAFVGRLGTVSLGASAIGGTYYLIFSLLCIGLASGAQIIISRRSGEQNHQEIGAVFVQNFYLMATFGALLYLLIQFFSPFILQKIIASPEIYAQTVQFTSYRAWGIIFVAINAVYSSFYVGISRTKILSYSTAIMTGVNIILDYLLIFGHFGFPQMGISGAALASSISEFVTLLFVIAYTQRNINVRDLGLYKFTIFNFQIITKNIILGYPIMFQYFFSLASWFLFFVIIEKMGEQTLAVANILRSILLLFMMPIWGLATTANTFTGNLLGQGKRSLIPILIRRIINIGAIFGLFFAPFVLFFPSLLAQIYSDDILLIERASQTIWIVYLTMFTFIPGVILNNALSGTGDTKSAFYIEMMASVLYLFYAYLVALVFNLPFTFIWASELIYWGFIGVLSFYRLKSGKWRNARV